MTPDLQTLEAGRKLTAKEKLAIQRLQDLATDWPDSLWLFAASNSLCVMKKDGQGHRVMTHLGSFDQSAMVADVNIESDGGDF